MNRVILRFIQVPVILILVHEEFFSILILADLILVNAFMAQVLINIFAIFSNTHKT